MSQKNVWQFAPALLALGIVVYVLVSSEPVQPVPSPSETEATTSPPTTASPVNTAISSEAIEAYVRENIAELSPTPAVLGGTFYVTKVEAQGGSGVVWYEDGHIALVADFTYNMDSTDSLRIDSFLVR